MDILPSSSHRPIVLNVQEKKTQKYEEGNDLGGFQFDGTDRPDPTFGKTDSASLSNWHNSRMLYTYPEEC